MKSASPDKSDIFVLSSDAENLETFPFCEVILSKSWLHLRMCTLITLVYEWNNSNNVKIKGSVWILPLYLG